jgi:hypothetical protein
VLVALNVLGSQSMRKSQSGGYAAMRMLRFDIASASPVST